MIEAEFDPGANVEVEATSRLGKEATVGRAAHRGCHRSPLSQPAFTTAADLEFALRGAGLSYCLFTEERDGLTRFPESGWLDRNRSRTSPISSAKSSLPQRAVDRASDALGDVGSTEPSGGCTETAALRPVHRSERRHRRSGHDERAAVAPHGLRHHRQRAHLPRAISRACIRAFEPLNLTCGEAVANPQNEVLAAWTRILEINYWPVFAIARDILEQLPAGDAAANSVGPAATRAVRIDAAGVDNSHDLTGRVFQRLIADRKYLQPAFYTLPASAALLARLAVARMQGVDWSDPEAIGGLRVADFACGTGATALGGLRADNRPPRADRRRPCRPSPRDDGGGPLRLRRDFPQAVHITGSYSLRRRAWASASSESRIYNFALRSAGRWECEDRLVGAAAMRQRR